MQNLHVVITGGAGFIGSHLCEKYLAQNYTVTAIDCLHTGSLVNLRNFLELKNFKFINHDIINPIDLSGVDLLLNFACPASPVHYQEDPIWTAKVGFLGTLNMLGVAKKNKARFIQASTSEVYGDPLQHPQQETYWGNVNTIGIRSCYDEGKRIGETLCFDYIRRHNVDAGLVRIFNTYGPQMALNDGRVVSNFIIQALKNEDITVYGDGLQTRSFCYVDDLVAGIMKFADAKGKSGPINLGNEGEFTVLELAKKVINLTESRSKIRFEKLPSDDPKTRRPDLTLTRKTIQWEPTIKLEDGLKKAIPYFRTRLK